MTMPAKTLVPQFTRETIIASLREVKVYIQFIWSIAGCLNKILSTLFLAVLREVDPSNANISKESNDF